MKKPKTKTLMWCEKTKTPNPKVVTKKLNPEPQTLKSCRKTKTPNEPQTLINNPKNVLFEQFLIKFGLPANAIEFLLMNFDYGYCIGAER